MSGMCDTCEKSYLKDGTLMCDDIKCGYGSQYIPKQKGIPISWIQEQIKKNPGRHASSWQYLLDIWEKHLFKARCSQQPIENKDQSSDGYVRMHKDPTAAQKFWRNE